MFCKDTSDCYMKKRLQIAQGRSRDTRKKTNAVSKMR